ncbi:Predicted DNA-binding transcriptional regulator YafY, contains an HTH and WYL domains [Marisediminitalea aggregata]|uniref:Predicted DNA-binding transcriptional regulator YafY, contains an HTH and WYL domains n=1 Tax=Marisediminitalea aggregata TaxID=634436 RepID=A0A1M5P2M9_9ALTE|nr:YafY family protein [Marisediminitalea aggregata]MAH56310.1 YafY family transcriptional regulator [Aestuariibacter sp.]MAP20271.1 YafY family transcriptional regulator [Alteromonadaceae bacterium]MEC7826151.1 YafY family protein [Pseudomonadota bacterium]HBY37964.1 YafY family transcriptional regulator [Alteromonas sp.]MAX43785.1 YafY family transcriptional regulator [Alteromonadaceae bacterium]|tara:strand:+ start:22212 stop:22898 length:687 start_codon:yes stop_codon:yes gene_type:complete
MRKAERLNEIVHHLRRMHQAVTADTLAALFEVSPRTIYRDIQDLMDSGIPITGEAGVGYVIDKQYHLPPIMFDADEIEAIALGIGMVSNWTDAAFARKAKSAYEKIQATLTAPMIHELTQISTFSAPSRYKIPWKVNFTEVRECIRRKQFVTFSYLDLSDQVTERTIRPLALISFSPIWLLAGWCEMRQNFRNFRLDRISDFSVSPQRFRDEKGKALSDYLKEQDECV